MARAQGNGPWTLRVWGLGECINVIEGLGLRMPDYMGACRVEEDNGESKFLAFFGCGVSQTALQHDIGHWVPTVREGPVEFTQTTGL